MGIYSRGWGGERGAVERDRRDGERGAERDFGERGAGGLPGEYGNELQFGRGKSHWDEPGGKRSAGERAGGGIYDSASFNVVGGTTQGARNVISGNTGDGISINSADSGTMVGPTGNVVEGNYIGTTAAGTAALANGNQGVDIFNQAQNNTIGGTSAGSGNLISGNAAAGVAISTTSTTGNLVEGNAIGVGSTGTAIPNTLEGVSIFGGAQSNVVGGTTAGAGNVLADNKDVGVGIYNEATPTSNVYDDSIRENSIFGNTNGGIYLGSGSNNAQAAPTISTVTQGAGTTTVAGTVTGKASVTYTVEFFASPSGSQGQTFVGATTSATNGSGTGTFSFTLPDGVPSGQVITATATDPSGNTSTFSGAKTVPSGGSGKLAQTITFPGIAGESFNAGPITLNATASSGLAVSYGVTSGPATVSGGVVTITGAGSITIQATQAGNSTYAAATAVSQSFMATPAAQTITFPTLASTTYGNGTVTLGATASSGLGVSYTVSGPASLSGNMVLITGVGTVTVTAAQGGSTNYAAATSVSQAFSVRQGTQTITFPAIANQTVGGPAVTLEATASSGLAISYSVISGPATVSGSQLTTTGAGTVVVQANQSGGGNYLAAAAVDQSFTVSSASSVAGGDSPTMPTWGLGLLMALLLAMGGMRMSGDLARVEPQ